MVAVPDVRRCLNCEAELTPAGKRGRPAAWCSRTCRNHTLYLRHIERARGFDACTLCSKPMQPTPTAAQVRVCLPCRKQRRATQKAKPAEVGPWLKVCILKDCGKTYLAEKKSRQFCSTDCFLACHRAQERIRDAERRRRRREEIPVSALLWYGDVDAGALIAGPPAETADVLLRLSEYQNLHHPEGTYEVRCPACGWLTDSLDPPDAEHLLHVWGCQGCYIKFWLIEPPAQSPDPCRRIEPAT